MRAIKEARKFIEKNANNEDAKTLSLLVLALESEADFPITNLYRLDYDNFRLAIEILDEWRLDRYYNSKVKLFDASKQLATGQPGDGSKPARPEKDAKDDKSGDEGKASDKKKDGKKS